MTKRSRFSASNSLGAADPKTIGNYLHSIGDTKGAALFLASAPAGNSFNMPFVSQSWHNTGMSIGYIAPSLDESEKVAISGATSMKGDIQLIGKRIKITLDKFYVHQYPGKGEHRILCEFAGKNQLANEAEEMRFALNTTARDGQSASISGHPIFMGVTVGADGISFEGRTINVSSSDDDGILKALDSPAFKNGLALITSAQPALKPFTGLASSVVEATAKRSRNKQVHNFNLGLDFSKTATSAKLRIGSYLVVQTEGTAWDWDQYEWGKDAMSLRDKKTGNPIEANYMVLGISEFSDELPTAP